MLQVNHAHYSILVHLLFNTCIFFSGGAKNYKIQWAGNVSTFKAGTAGLLEIFLTDQYNNPVKELDDTDDNPIFESYIKSNKATKGIVDLKVAYGADTSQVSVSFLAVSTGKYSLFVMKNNESLPDSPFSFEVVPGITAMAFSSLSYIPFQRSSVF